MAMSERELIAVINSELDDSIGNNSSTDSQQLKDQRRNAMNYYFAKKFGNEVKGRSQVISHDVMDTIEWIMPSMMRVFSSTEEFATFTPESANDVEAAKQEMQYVNYVFDSDNRGFMILHNMIKDALLLKTGIAKAWWNESEEETTEEYTGLSPEGVQALFDTDDTIEIIESSTNIEPGALVPADAKIDVKIKRIKDGGRAEIRVVAPENFIISKRAESIKDASIVGEYIRTTRAELKEQGFDKETIDKIPSSSQQEDDEERLARFAQEGDDFSQSLTKRDREPIWIKEVYLHVDENGDGVRELLKVTLSENDLLLDKEEVDEKPFVSMSPIVIPHKFYGLSVADLVTDIQLIKSTLMRNILDNVYNLNNGRFVGLEGAFNLDDLLNSRPGGVVREKVPNAVRRLDTPPLPNGAFQMLDQMDAMLASRTGSTKFSQGLDANVLQNTTATAIAQQQSASQARIEMIVRIFAETGIKDLFMLLHGVLRKNQRKQRIVQLAGEFVPVNPSQWRERKDMTITVGLGRGDKDTRVQNLSLIGQVMQQVGQSSQGIVGPQNIYNAAVAMVKALGMKNDAAFFNDPSKQPPPEPQPSPEEILQQIEQAKLQAKMQVEMAQLKLDEQELQLKAMRTQAEIQKWEKELEIEQAELIAETALEVQQNRAVALGDN